MAQCWNRRFHGMFRKFLSKKVQIMTWFDLEFSMARANLLSGLFI